MTAVRYILFAALVVLTACTSRHWVPPEPMFDAESEKEPAEQIQAAAGNRRVVLTMRDLEQYRGTLATLDDGSLEMTAHSVRARGQPAIAMGGEKTGIDPRQVGYLRSYGQCPDKEIPQWDRLELRGCYTRTWAAPDLLDPDGLISEEPNAVSLGLHTELVALAEGRFVRLRLRSGADYRGHVTAGDAPWVYVRTGRGEKGESLGPLHAMDVVELGRNPRKSGVLVGGIMATVVGVGLVGIGRSLVANSDCSCDFLSGCSGDCGVAVMGALAELGGGVLAFGGFITTLVGVGLVLENRPGVSDPEPRDTSPEEE
jgi:hypothetical protein